MLARPAVGFPPAAVLREAAVGEFERCVAEGQGFAVVGDQEDAA